MYMHILGWLDQKMPEKGRKYLIMNAIQSVFLSFFF